MTSTYSSKKKSWQNPRNSKTDWLIGYSEKTGFTAKLIIHYRKTIDKNRISIENDSNPG